MIRLVQGMRVFDIECECGWVERVINYSPLMACGQLEHEGWRFPVVDERLQVFCPMCGGKA